MLMPHQQRPGQNCSGGPKVPKKQNIRVCFVFKLIRGP